MKDINILILVGGFGTRLKSIVSDVPKPMAPIIGKPFLDYQIKEIKKYFPKNKIYLLTYYLSEVIEDYFKNDSSIHIIKEEVPLGTGGSISNAINFLNLKENDSLIVFNGDTYIKPNLKKMINNTSNNLTIIGSFQHNCDRYGTLKVEDNKIIDFLEKKEGLRDFYINAGCYFFKKIIFFYSIKEKSFSIEEKFKEYLLTNTIDIFRYKGVFIDIGVPKDYTKMINHIKEIKQSNRYLVNRNDSIEQALIKIEKNHLGVIFIENKNRVIGCATDGDIRRFLLKEKKFDLPIYECINTKFVFLFEKNATKENILKLLDTRIRAIPILNDNYELISVTSQKNINWNEKEKIISKAKSPVRISFAGGGTDLTTYFSIEDGVVLNTTINKFSHAVLQKRDDNKIKIFSNDLNQEINISGITEIKFDGKLDLIKSVIKLLNPDFGFELYTYSDVPPGSGLGGSAVLLSAIIGTFNNFRENKFNDYEIAELAFHAERVELGLAGGWQDQYATVFGGFNFMEFKNHENIVNPLRISDNIINELEDSLILCYTGLTHNSGNIHNDQKKQMNKDEKKEYAQISKDIAYQMKSRLLKGKLDDFGSLLHKAWMTKKNFSDKITNSFLDEIYEFALQNGAIGGKLLGAGGGGYFLFYVPTFNKISFINALEKRNLEIETFTFDNIGLRSWITKEKI